MILASAVGCGGGGPARPVAALPTSLEAQHAFEGVREAWDGRTAETRRNLEERLEAFLSIHAGDGLAPMARAYLAFLYFEDGRDDAAGALLVAGPVLPPGTARDLQQIGKARLLRRQGDAAAAFEILKPLLGKVVDNGARSLFGEEITLAALATHRDYEAVAYMDAWLRGVGEDDRDEVRAEVKTILARVPTPVLEGALRSMRAAAGPGGVSGGAGYGPDIQRLVTERLAEAALASGDVELARWLVAGTVSRTGVGAGETNEALGELAVSQRGAVRVAGQTLGLVLPTQDPRRQDRAAEVMRGVAWALDLPRREGDARGGPRLVTRDEGALDERLDEVAGEGAAVILAALDGATADGALRWANRRRVPVVVLAAPKNEAPGAYGFVAGQDDATELTALAEAFASRHVTAVAPVVDRDGDFTPAMAHALAPLLLGDTGVCEVDDGSGEPYQVAPFPFAAWTKGRVSSWIMAGSLPCARTFFKSLSATPGGTARLVGLRLEASSWVLGASPSTGDTPPAVTLLATTAGVLRPGLSPSDPRVADLAAFTSRSGRGPSYTAALGRDAAVLARRASASLPANTTTDEAEVTRRREECRTALEGVRAPLWSTDLDTFDAHHTLPRTLTVESLRPRR